MRASYDDQERALLEGFDATLRRLPDHASAIDTGKVDRETVVRLGRPLAAGGWLEVADPDSESGQRTTVLAGLAEVASRRAVALPFPLLEAWLAVRILRRAGAAEEAEAVSAGRSLITLAVDLLGGNRVEGTTGWLPHAGAAERALLLLPNAGGARVVLADLPGLQLADAPAIDLATPSFVAPIAEDGYEAGRLDAAQLTEARCLYLVLQAAAMVGAADHLFAKTIGYLKEREQFGVRLSSFQALQHQAADLLTSLEAARSLAYYAAWCVDVVPERMEEFALTAKGFCGEACWGIAGAAIQLHGGIGMTWEGELHYNLCRIAWLAMAGRNAAECLAAAGAAAIAAGAMLTPVH